MLRAYRQVINKYIKALLIVCLTVNCAVSMTHEKKLAYPDKTKHRVFQLNLPVGRGHSYLMLGGANRGHGGILHIAIVNVGWSVINFGIVNRSKDRIKIGIINQPSGPSLISIAIINAGRHTNMLGYGVGWLDIGLINYTDFYDESGWQIGIWNHTDLKRGRAKQIGVLNYCAHTGLALPVFNYCNKY